MHRLRFIFYPVLTIILVVVTSGCDRYRTLEIERIKKSVDSRYPVPSANSSELRNRTNQQIYDAVKKATPESIRTPEFINAVVWKNALLEFSWIEDHPSADGVILRWPGNLAGTYLAMPPKLLHALRTDIPDLQFVVHTWGIPLQEFTANGLVLPGESVEIALAKNGREMSSYIPCIISADGPNKSDSPATSEEKERVGKGAHYGPRIGEGK